MTHLKPLGERVLLKLLKQSEERTKSGLYLPKGMQEKKEGEVIAVGAMQNNQQFPIKVGDRVLYGGYSTEEIEVNGEKHLLIELKDIIAKVE